MARHRDFLVQLENFRHEANNAVTFLYADMAINYAASQSKVLLGRLNETATFWIAHAAASQTAAYICIGRIFDQKSKFNIDALLDSFEANLALFRRDALAERKRNGQPDDPPWLEEHLRKAHYPTMDDVKYLRRRVNDYRSIYERAIKPVRHKYLAHREKEDPAEVQALFAQGKVRELWRMAKFLQGLYVALREQYQNGRRPRVTLGRYSIKVLYNKEKEHGGGTHEHVINETRKLMVFLETATPNPLLKPRRRDGATQLGR